MEVHCIFILLFFSYCSGEWVLLPSFSSKKNDLSEQNKFRKNSNKLNKPEQQNMCPDFHNLTVMGYASKENIQTRTIDDLGLTVEDVKNLVEENEKIPKSPMEKKNFVNKIQQHLMMEAEKRLRSLFPSGSRKARFSFLHFPTMESSLMTISMLLFGVYLSKLIVKLLQSHYAKFNMPLRTMNGMRTPIIIAPGQKLRSADVDLQKIYLMDVLDKYDAQFN